MKKTSRGNKFLVPMQLLLPAALACLVNARSLRGRLLWGGLAGFTAALIFLCPGRRDSPEAALDRLLLRRKVLLWTGAGLICAGSQMAGILLRDRIPASPLPFAAFPFLLILLNSILESRPDHFPDPKTDPGKLPPAMDRCRRWAWVLTLGLALSAVGLAFTSGMMKPFWRICGFLVSCVCLVCCLCRIRIPNSLILQDMADPGDYPGLYALAEKAQEALGGSGEIRICFSADCNAGLAVQDRVRYLELGVTLLSVLTEQELYAVLLHEFGHAAASTPELECRTNDFLWLDSAPTGPVTEALLMAFFGYFDYQFSTGYRLYESAVSLQQELRADQAMLLCGDAATAGSALLKLAWYRCYQWEHFAPDNPYLPETMSKTNIRDAVRSFLGAIETRSGDWTRMTLRELPMPHDSHPTLRARLEAMGIRDIRPLPGAPAFPKEADSAIAYVDACFCSAMEPEYARRRQDFCLEPRKDVAAWQQAGMPLEEYPDILVALQVLGRMEEAESLCDRVIREGQHPEEARRLKGRILLHRYDPRGLALLTDADRKEILTFCCLTGRKTESLIH